MYGSRRISLAIMAVGILLPNLTILSSAAGETDPPMSGRLVLRQPISEETIMARRLRSPEQVIARHQQAGSRLERALKAVEDFLVFEIGEDQFDEIIELEGDDLSPLQTELQQNLMMVLDQLQSVGYEPLETAINQAETIAGIRELHENYLGDPILFPMTDEERAEHQLKLDDLDREEFSFYEVNSMVRSLHEAVVSYEEAIWAAENLEDASEARRLLQARIIQYADAINLASYSLRSLIGGERDETLSCLNRLRDHIQFH